jgi:hypothetical protein
MYYVISARNRGIYMRWTGRIWDNHPTHGLFFLDKAKAEEVLKGITQKPPNGAVPQILEENGSPPSWAEISN